MDNVEKIKIKFGETPIDYELVEHDDYDIAIVDFELDFKTNKVEVKVEKNNQKHTVFINNIFDSYATYLYDDIYLNEMEVEVVREEILNYFDISA